MISGKNTLICVSAVTRYFSFSHAFQMLKKFSDWIGNQRTSFGAAKHSMKHSVLLIKNVS